MPADLNIYKYDHWDTHIGIQTQAHTQQRETNKQIFIPNAVHTRACAHAHADTHTHTHTHMRAHTNKYKHIHTHTQLNPYTSAHTQSAVFIPADLKGYPAYVHGERLVAATLMFCQCKQHNNNYKITSSCRALSKKLPPK